MASVHRVPRSPYWMAKFRADDGRVVMRSTKQVKRKVAQDIADEWERAARKARAGELTQAVIIKTMAEMLERSLGETINLQSTKDFFTSWLQTPGRKSATIARYRPILQSFLTFISEQRARASVGSITISEIERFRDRKIAEGETATTTNLAVKVLRAVFGSAKRLGYALTNPAEGVRMLRESDAEERQPFTDDQLRDLLSVADNEWRGMILVGGHTGMRLHDAANLTWQNVDLAGRMLSFRDEKIRGMMNTNNTKTQKSPTVDREAVRVLAIELGARESARRLGIKESTVLSWARRYGWKLPKRKGGNGKNAITLAIKPGDALIAAHEDYEHITKTALMQVLAKAAKALAAKDALPMETIAQFKDACLAGAKLFGWDGKPAVAVQVNQAAVVISPEKRAELQERLRRLQEELPQPSLPAANTPTLPAPQMQSDGSTEAEAVVVADQEPFVIATAEDDPPNPLFLQGWEKEPELPRRSTRPHSRRGWWY